MLEEVSRFSTIPTSVKAPMAEEDQQGLPSMLLGLGDERRKGQPESVGDAVGDV